MNIETKRLLLRPWQSSDAEDLYTYACDVRVGPMAGWPEHTSIENSREIIELVLSAKETYAVVLKGEDKPIGSIGLMVGTASNLEIADNEGEIGYWLGVPYWGQGLIPEAVHALIHHGFENLNLQTLWCGYYDGNEKSHRVQEKCGFHYHHTNKDIFHPLMQETRTEYVSCIQKQEYEARKKDYVELTNS